MKRKVFLSLMFLIVSMFLYVSNTTAEYEPHTQWDLPEGAIARLGKGIITSNIAYSPDGTQLAVSGNIGIWIYDTATYQETALLTGHSFSVWSVAFSPDGKTIASGSGHPYGAWYGDIRLWNTGTGENVGGFGGEYDAGWGVAFSPGGRTLAVYGSSEGGNPVYLFDLDGSRERITITHTSGVNSVAFSPNSQTIAIGSRDGIHLWHTETGEHLHTFAEDTGGDSIIFSPDGQTLASCSENEIYFWDAKTGEQKNLLLGHESWVDSIVFSPDGRTLASCGGNELYLWDTETEAQKALIGHTGYLSSVAFSPDGQTLASCSGNALYFWDAKTGEHKKTLLGHTGSVNSVAFSPDGETLAMNGGYPDKTVRLWNADTGEHIRTLVGHTDGVSSVAFSPDGHIIASGSYDNTIRLWSADTGEYIETLIGHESSVYSVVFSPDGHIIASGSYDNTVRLWNVDTGDTIRTFVGHTESVNSVAFSPDGHTIVSGSGDNTVRLWNVDTGDTIRTFTADFEIHSVAFSPDGKMIASGSGWSGRFWSSGVLELWDVETGDLLSTLFESGDSDVHSVAFSPDGKTIAWGSRDGSIGLSDVLTRTHLTTLVGHGSVSSITFSPDGLTLASGGGEGTVLLWDLASLDDPRQFALDSGDTLETATTLALDTPHTESIFPGDDMDYFSIEVDQQGELTLYTTGNLDTVGELQTGDGTLLGTGDDEGDGSNFSIVYLVVSPGTYSLIVEGYGDSTGIYTVYAVFRHSADVNGDGVVNVLDLVLVAANFGKVDATPAHGDVNGDGEVNREDIIAVLDALEVQEAVGAPAAVSTTKSLQRWIDRAKQLNRTDADFQKGIAVLQNLLTTLREIETVPKETALLANYPNPFNPETWIPYQLAAPADVTVTIYAADGKLVRTLDIGHQPIGIYQSRSRAAHWDGKNNLGEPVASGVYFYTLTAGDFTATRKMLIRK